MIECYLPNVPRVVEDHVYLLTLDDYTPHGFLGGDVVGDELAQWQYAVEFTYRCLASGLCELIYDNSSARGLDKINELCIELSRLDPFQLTQDGERFWLDTFMCATDCLIEIVREHIKDSDRGAFERGMFEAVDRRFSAAGVAWSKGCFFPVECVQKNK